jgi:sugar phosphate isomerase/epimerase
MKFGICTGPGEAAVMKTQGWDYVEDSVQALLQGTLQDEQWKGEERAANRALPILSANMLVPGNLKITGPDADLAKLQTYMQNVLKRAARLGLRVLVFGSGGARQIPDGFDRAQARDQIISFLKMSGPIAQAHGVTVVIEHLNQKECNVITSFAEGVEYARAVNHPNIRILVDTYHLWLEKEPLENVASALSLLAHVHVADETGRVAPGESGKDDYRPLFKLLKNSGYAGLISVECTGFKIAEAGPRVLAFLKNAWAAA